MTVPVFHSRPTAIFTLLPSTGSCLDAYITQTGTQSDVAQTPSSHFMSRIKMEAGSGAGYVRLAGTHRALLQNDVDRATSLLNCKWTCIDKFMYIQARLASSIIICMHALHVITLKHCHIMAMGMTLLQLRYSL